MRTEKEVRDVLAKPDIHDLWNQRYHTPENERFFDLAFDVIAAEFRANADDVVLDVGSGPGHHTLRLVRRGFRVEAIDFSDTVIQEARARLEASGFADRIVLKKGDVTQLSYPDEAFSSILCWGVLMHVPEARKAIAELCRVLKKGGTIVLGENNGFSLQSRTWRSLQKLRRRAEVATVLRKPEGIEKWKQYDAGLLLTREFDNQWLIREFESHGLRLTSFRARQFTEMFVMVPSAALRKLIHRFNYFWFQYVKSPRLSQGTLLVFRKA